MRTIYIFIVLVIAAFALGCVGNKQAETSTNIPVSPEQTSVPSSGTSVSPPNSGDDFGTGDDLTSIDAMISDADTDIILSEAI